MTYEHPVYDPAALAAQRRLPELNDGVTAYAGAYHGWGFHEDGCRAGWPPPSRWEAAGDRAVRHAAIRHVRTAPVAQRVHLPQLPVAGRPGRPAPAAAPGCGRWRASGPPTTSATRAGASAQNVDAFLAGHGVDLARRPHHDAGQRPGARATSSTRCQSSGATQPTAALACVIAEVHNTYGQRHCYLLRTDERGPGRGRQGVLRLPVQPGRRPLPDVAARARRARSR